MADVLLHDVDEDLIDRLSEQADRHGLSVNEEILRILAEATPPKLTWPEVAERAAALRAAQAPNKTRAVDLIREDRDRR